MRQGVGDYCREMTVLQRVLRQNARGNWVANFDDKGRADHYAHAEAYCYLATFNFPERPFLKV